MTKRYLKYSLFRSKDMLLDEQHYYIHIINSRNIDDVEAYAKENISATEYRECVISDVFPDLIKYSVVYLEHVCRF